MSVFRFSNNLSFSREDREEIVIVTSKQYLAIADDFLHKLFPNSLETGYLIQDLLPSSSLMT